MGRQTVIDTTLHQHLHQLDVVRIHVGFAFKCDARRFLIGALAQANANPFRQQLFDIALRALQVGLNHGTHAILIPRHAMQFVNEVQGALRIGRTFHIDPHKARRLHGCRFTHQAGHEFASHFLVHIQPHVCQFQTDVRVQVVGDDGIENLVVELRAVPRFVGIGNVLAQVIDADAHARAVDRLRDPHRVGNFRARHKPAGNPLTDRRSFGEIPQRTIFRQLDEERPQHEVPAGLEKAGKEIAATGMKTTEICITPEDLPVLTRRTPRPLSLHPKSHLNEFSFWLVGFTRCSERYN